MSAKADKISVVSTKAKSYEKINNIELIPCRDADLNNNPKPLIADISKIISDNDNTVIQFFGYNPKLIIALNKLRKHNKGVRLSAIVYDTHLGVLSDKPLLKKLVICLYYNLGILLLRKADRIILFKSTAKSRLRIKRKTLTVLPAVSASEIKSFIPTANSEIRFLYSGTLCEYNCIKQLINAFKSLNNPNAELEIFGDGPLEQFVRNAADNDGRIRYFGRISGEELREYISKADVTVNLRTVPSVVNDYAFPSKVVEYMKEGKAVLSTNVSENREFEQAVFLVEPFNETNLLSVMSGICKKPASIEEKVCNSKAYLEKYHNNEVIAGQISDYLFAEKL